MINATQFVNDITNSTTEELLSKSAELFIPSIIAYWLIQFFLTLILGLIFVKTPQGRQNFWVIFIFAQLIGAIILFFIFFFPFVPQILESIGIG